MGVHAITIILSEEQWKTVKDAMDATLANKTLSVTSWCKYRVLRAAREAAEGMD